MVKLIKHSIMILLILLSFNFFFNKQKFLSNKIIGMINHPGLQGEILFQKNIIYNFEKGNLFRYFNTEYLNYPFGEKMSFAVANSLHLFLYIPLKFIFGLIASYNISVIIIFILNFLSAYLLAKYLFSLKTIALCSALVFTLNPYTLLKLNMGFLQKSVLFWIPLYCLALFRLQDLKRWRYAFEAGFILSLMQLTYPPYAYFAVILTAVLSLYSLLKRNELRFAISSFIFIIISLFIFTSLIYYFMGFGFVYFKMCRLNINTNLDGCLDLFRPFRFLPYHSHQYPTDLPLGISFSAFLLGVVSLIKMKDLPRLIFFSLIFFVIIAAGPYLASSGRLITTFGHKIILPFYLIIKYLPFAREIFFPIRVFPFINICLSILTGYGLLYFLSTFKKIKSSLITILFLVIYLSELIIFFPQLFPPKISDMRVPKFYQKIKNENFEAILNLPISSTRKIINLYGYYTALSEKKMMNSYDKDELQIYFPKNTDNEQLKKEFIDFLSYWRVGYVVVHENFLTKDTSGKPINEFSWLENFCDSETYPEDKLLVYKIPLPDKLYGNGNIISIPRDFPSIQNGIDRAKEGDVLLVSPGKYVETINFRGKKITVKSQYGPDVTIIDGDKKGSVVIFNSGENNESVLEGFTIQNGLVEYGKNKGGGGILCYKSRPLIKNNIIKNNKAENGGGILCQDCLDKKPIIISNLIKNNEAVKGGGIRCSDSSPIIINNIIIGNNAERLGGGIYWRQSSSPYIVNNTIMYNIAGEYGGGVFGSNAVTLETPLVLSNSIFWGNRAPRGTQIALNLSGTKVTVASSVVQYGKGGIFLMTDNISLNYLPDNISTDPRIKEIDKASLMNSSPCIDAGENKYIASLDIAVDFSGNNRILDGNTDGNPIVDIGAREFSALKDPEEM